MTDSSATKHPPSNDDLRAMLIVGWMFLVLYFVVYGSVTWPAIEIGVPRLPDSALDFAVRNQAWVVGLAGSAFAAWVGMRAWRRGAIQQAILETAPDVAHAGIASVLASRGAPAVVVAIGKAALGSRLLPFSLPIALCLALILTAATSGVVSADAGLELPPMTREISAAPGERDLVLFIHGWNGDDQGTWRRFPDLVVVDPQFAEYDVWSIGYPTFMIRRQLSVAGVANFFVVQFMDVYRLFDRYRRIVVVAHSMGGLVTREVAIQVALRGRQVSFHQLIEIGVPHEGARPAGLISALGLSADLTRDMRSNSDFLRDLKTHWNALASKPPTFCVGSPQDRVVPHSSAIAQCADQTSYLEGGHTEIVKPESLRDYRYTVPMSRVLAPATRRSP